MPKDKKLYRIFISAAEPSADSHCAGLINALKQTNLDIEFVGVGGPKMEQTGCQLLEKTGHKAAMLLNAFKQVGHFYLLITRIKRYLKKNPVDLVIVCDSPAFNFHIAKAAKKLKTKTLFYVAPQLWAWGQWRIEKLKKCCDKLCCILPFEQDFFEQKGIDTTFVGNPLLDDIEDSLDTGKKDFSNFEPTKLKLALMPGSRPAEISALWPPMQQIALKLKRKYPNIDITAVAVDQNKKEVLKSLHLIGFRCKYETGSVTEVASQSDFTIVASGSATLQVAAAGCPMVIIYQSNKVGWHLLGRWLLKTKYLSLVNILAQKELVPEFMPFFTSTDPILKSIEALLNDPEKLTKTSNDLIELTTPLKTNTAAKKTAKEVTKLLTA